jgi:hypothetical protein
VIVYGEYNTPYDIRRSLFALSCLQTLFSGPMMKLMFFYHSYDTEHLFVTKVTSAVNGSLHNRSGVVTHLGVQVHYVGRLF